MTDYKIKDGNLVEEKVISKGYGEDRINQEIEMIKKMIINDQEDLALWEKRKTELDKLKEK